MAGGPELKRPTWTGSVTQVLEQLSQLIPKVEDPSKAVQCLTELSIADALGRCPRGGGQGRRRPNGVLRKIGLTSSRTESLSPSVYAGRFFCARFLGSILPAIPASFSP